VVEGVQVSQASTAGVEGPDRLSGCGEPRALYGAARYRRWRSRLWVWLGHSAMSAQRPGCPKAARLGDLWVHAL